MIEVIKTKSYEKEAAFVNIKGAIYNPINYQQQSFTLKCRVDTGFDGGILVPYEFYSDIQIIGIQPLIRQWTLADGEKKTVYICAAYIHSIDSYEFGAPGKPVKFVIPIGNKEIKLIGMNLLKYFITTFNGQNKNFSVIIA